MKYALKNVNIITGYNTEEILFNKVVIIKNRKILEIKDQLTEKIKCYDLKGRFLMPGLINLHVHLPGSGMPNHHKKQTKESVNKLMKHGITRSIIKKMCAHYAKVELLSGVTTIRTVGGLSNFDSTIANKIDEGKIIGPRMVVSNMALSVPGGHMADILAYSAHNPFDAINLVNKIYQDHPKYLKLMITGGVTDAKEAGEPGVVRMEPEIVKAATTQAHNLKMKVSAHVESREGVRIALENGVDTIEHGASLLPNEVMLFKKNNSKLVTTISPALPLVYFSDSLNLNETEKINSKIVFDGIISCAKTCLENDILVGLGTDTACLYVTHYNMWRELAYFKHFVGVSNAYAIHTATLKNAQILGLDDITGSIEVGKSADFIVLNENPLKDLRTLKKPYMVGFRGKIYKKPRVKKYKIVEQCLDEICDDLDMKF